MEFSILGPLEVHGASGLVDLGGDRQRKLLAILLVNANLSVPVERMVDELWSDPPRTARRQVYNGVAALRRRLVEAGFPSTALHTEAGGYRIRLDQAVLDADLVRQRIAEADRAVAQGRNQDAIHLLAAAVSQWRGNTLDGSRTPLLDSVAARFDEQRIGLVERLAELRLAAGEGSSLVSELKEYVARYPLRESLRGSMMLALYRSGRQAEALATFDEGRHRLAEDLGLDPGVELRRIHTAVLRGTGHPPARKAYEPAAPAATPATCTSYLPPRLSDFVGRQDSIAQATEAVEWAAEANRPTVLVIDGMGGVGKTAFAVHLAHRMAERYPDGQYFVDLRGFSARQHPLSPEAVVDALLRQAGLPPALKPFEFDAEAARLRAALAGRRVLMLLDNVADTTLVPALLPGTPGSLVLVTSRRQLIALPDSHPVSLRPLGPDCALQLFKTTCGQNRVTEELAASKEVVRLCGHLPLAVRAAGSRLRHRPMWTVADLVRQLQHPSQRLRLLGPHEQTVSDTLLTSYHRLSDAHQRLFRLLGRQSGPRLSARSCAATARMPLAALEQGLETLADDNLITACDRKRYQLHPLLRDLAIELNDREKSTTAVSIEAIGHASFGRASVVSCRSAADGPHPADGSAA
ncbi:BTAD domain-containing putative transcriptional regulator [Micromonospora sp. NPDC048871]|uniref:AfsR/SARP family transcriptional regulator n=1 Tax=unclassified Micromonospora TaxID=2617518 RepID=UPI002E0E694A|nr:NB-ARC domain-containing protein [Micromonospora sp. NBC_01739]